MFLYLSKYTMHLMLLGHTALYFTPYCKT